MAIRQPVYTKPPICGADHQCPIGNELRITHTIDSNYPIRTRNRSESKTPRVARRVRVKYSVCISRSRKLSTLSLSLSLFLSLSPAWRTENSACTLVLGERKASSMETVSIAFYASTLSSKRLIKLKRLSCTKSWSWMIVAALDLKR